MMRLPAEAATLAVAAVKDNVPGTSLLSVLLPGEASCEPPPPQAARAMQAKPMTQ